MVVLLVIGSNCIRRKPCDVKLGRHGFLARVLEDPQTFWAMVQAVGASA